jgi:hypothetical protein
MARRERSDSARHVQYVSGGAARTDAIAYGADAVLPIRVVKRVQIEPAIEHDTAVPLRVTVPPDRPLTTEEQAVAVLVAQLMAMFVSLDLDASGLEAAWSALVTYLVLRALVRRLPPRS